MTCPNRFNKDPDAVLEYKFDWAALTNGSGQTDWLASGEIINTFTITAPSGITVDSSLKTDSDTSITVWLSGGTAGEMYNIICHIVTDNSPAREEDKIIIINMI